MSTEAIALPLPLAASPATEETPRRYEQNHAWGQWLAQIARGEAQAMERLYDESRGLVYGLALRILRDPAEAEEMALDVYTQVWRTARSFDARRSSASAWLVLLTRSRAIDRLRYSGSRMRHSEDPLEEASGESSACARLHGQEASVATDPEAACVAADQRRRVRAAMNQLTPEQRRAIELAFFAGYTHTELAAHLGEPLGTVKTRVRLALLKLRDLLSPVPAFP